MKEDVERRERAQAKVIENQAKRLEELETLYKVLQGFKMWILRNVSENRAVQLVQQTCHSSC